MRPSLFVRLTSGFTRAQWLLLGAVSLTFIFVIPFMHLAIPEGHALHVSSYTVKLIGRILCYALLALAMDLIWGYGGILSLGQGLFFALGGYAMGMYLMRQIGRDGVYRSELPDFMVFLDWKTLPWYWQGSDYAPWALFCVMAVPGLLALVFGYFAFRSRIKGVYFSIITQALTYAFMLLFFRNETGFGGNNGFTDFKRIFGYSITSPETRAVLMGATALTLTLAFIVARWMMSSKYGRVLQAVRDAESRAMFCGYNPVGYKLFIWVFAAVLSGIAGALYVPQVGVINPSEMTPAFSIEIAIWTAVGGRGTLIGPILGAAVINGAKSWFTVAFPEYWLFFLGGIFVLATLYLPRGIVGLRWRRKTAAAAPELEPTAAKGATS